MWEVIHRLIDGEPMDDAEKGQAHKLTDTHLAQHLGIARTQGEHREDLRDHKERLRALEKPAQA
jgi:hypothetical protein